MALRLSVALATVFAAWMLIAASLLPPHRTPLPDAGARTPPSRAAAALLATVAPHAEVHRLEGIAWLRASAVPATPDSGLWLAVDTSLPEPVAQRVRDAAVGKWRAVQTWQGAPRVYVGTVDTRHDPHDAPRLHLWRTDTAFELPADRAAACLVLVALGGGTINRASALDRSPSFTLGPCAFYARFGHPGAGVARWLREGAAALAANPDWDTPANAPAARAARQAQYAPRFYGPFRGMPLSSAACLAGDDTACREVVLDARFPALDYLPGRAGDFVVVGRGTDEEEWLLADLVRAFGAERFERFWRSDADPPQAFREAFGQRPADWYREWALTVYGELPSGTRQKPMTVLASLGVLAGLVAVGAGLAGRRQAT